MAIEKKWSKEERQKLAETVASGASAGDFESLALEIFWYQFRFNPIYQKYVNLLNVNIKNVQSLWDIPFLPISFFKHEQVRTGPVRPATTVFRSSGTTGQEPAQHFVPSLKGYTHNAVRGFCEAFSTALEDVYFLALLPSYLERQDASLVHMAKAFTNRSQPLPKHFFLDDFSSLARLLDRLVKEDKPIFLLGVTFALLEFAEKHPGHYEGLTVIETGGMKGRGPEWVRPELHAKLRAKLRGANISSEYGMTELLSQAYWGEGYYRASRNMRVFPREITDPLARGPWEHKAALNIIDLANIDSCAFIATSDLGRVQKGGRIFEVLGRLDQAEIRGCNLMYMPS